MAAYNRKGEKITIKTGGLLSIIFQHEIDHLDGVLFIDRAHTVHDIANEKKGALI
jgi:peptide deformylase